jgi:copper(I)-binding protein
MRFSWTLPRQLLAASLGLFLASHAFAHGFKVGSVTLDHPYLVIAKSGEPQQVVLHFLKLHNAGAEADRLLSVRCDEVAAIELHRSAAPPAPMALRKVDAIDLPAGQAVNLRHDSGANIMLTGLKRPLRDGDSLRCVARFERAGEGEFTAHVQTPRSRAAKQTARAH